MKRVVVHICVMLILPGYSPTPNITRFSYTGTDEFS